MQNQFWVVLAALALLIVYFIPAIVADKRDTLNRYAVYVVNIFLGWTFLGWVIALALAFGGQTKRDRAEMIAAMSTQRERP